MCVDGFPTEENKLHSVSEERSTPSPANRCGEPAPPARAGWGRSLLRENGLWSSLRRRHRWAWRGDGRFALGPAHAGRNSTVTYCDIHATGRLRPKREGGVAVLMCQGPADADAQSCTAEVAKVVHVYRPGSQCFMSGWKRYVRSVASGEVLGNTRCGLAQSARAGVQSVSRGAGAVR